MADDIKIRVDADRATLEQLTRALKDTKTEMLSASREALPALRAEADALKNKIRELSTNQQGLMSFLREARAENRMQNFLLREGQQAAMGLSGAIGTLTAGIGAQSSEMRALNATLGTGVSTFQGLDFAAQGMTTALGLSGAAIGGVTLGVSALVAGGVALFSYFQQSKEEAEKARKAAEGYAQSLANIALAKEKLNMIDFIEAQKALEHARDMAKMAFYTYEGDDKAEKARLEQSYLDAELARKNHWNEMYKIVKDGVEKEAKEKESAEKEERERWDKEWEEHQRIVGQKLDAAARDAKERRRKQEEYSERSKVHSVKTGSPIDIQKEVGTKQDILAGVLKENFILVESLQSGFAALGGTIQREFIDKIIGSTSVFQQFVGGVLGGLARIAEQAAASALIAGILSMIPGVGAFSGLFKNLMGFAEGGVLTEPVVGVGMSSGRGYSFAERGAERISPLTNFSGRGGVQAVQLSGEFRVRGRDLVYATKQGFIVDRKRGGNF